MTEAPPPSHELLARQLAEVRVELATAVERWVAAERERDESTAVTDEQRSRDRRDRAVQEALIAEQGAVLHAALERIEQLQAELAASAAALEESVRRDRATRSELQALYDSDTWRLGRLVWHAGRRSGLSALVRRPGKRLLDRSFGAPSPAPSTEPSAPRDDTDAAAGASPDNVPADRSLLLRAPYRRAMDSAWEFPGDRRWRGQLRHLADEFSMGSVPPDHHLAARLDEFRLDAADTLIANRAGDRGRDALHQLRLALVGRAEALIDPALTVVDARCLTDADLRHRGIGRHASTVAGEVSSQLAEDDRIVALVADGWSGAIDALPRARTMTVSEFVRTKECPARFVSLSPATHSVVPECLGVGTHAVAIAYDLIPLSFPRQYHATAEDLVDYVARLAWLRHFDEVWCISEATARVHQHAVDLPMSALRFTGVHVDRAITRPLEDSTAVGPVRVLLCGGSDPRKNLLTPLIGLRTVPFAVDVEVLGALPQEMAAELHDVIADLGDRTTLEFLGQVDDERVSAAFRDASIVIVPSHAEGFSLPVAEAVEAGRTVLASDIDVHRELIGDGPWLVPPSNAGAWARGIVDAVDHLDTWHSSQEAAYRASIVRRRPPDTALRTPPNLERGAPAHLRRHRPSLAIVTPLPPQPTGVADYSAHTLTPLERHFDVTWVVNDRSEVGDGIGPVRADTITTRLAGFDHVLHVVGNSHFHIPALEHLRRFGGPVIAHDNRMTGVYALWRGATGAARVMSMHGATVSPEHAMFYIVDVDGAPDSAYGEIAAAASPLMVHSEQLASRLSVETGTVVSSIPFCPYRIPAPDEDVRRPRYERTGRRRIGTFGEISIVFKRHDLMIEMIDVLGRSGVDVELVVIGGGTDQEIAWMRSHAEAAGVSDRLVITGRVDDATYRRWLREVDVAVQVRNSGSLTLSGAVMDGIAYGVPLVTTRSIAAELPDALAVVAVDVDFDAERLAVAVQEAWAPPDHDTTEDARIAFLGERTPERYADAVAQHVLDAAP